MMGNCHNRNSSLHLRRAPGENKSQLKIHPPCMCGAPTLAWRQQCLLQCEWGTGFGPLRKSASTWCLCGAPAEGPVAVMDVVVGHRLWVPERVGAVRMLESQAKLAAWPVTAGKPSQKRAKLQSNPIQSVTPPHPPPRTPPPPPYQVVSEDPRRPHPLLSAQGGAVTADHHVALAHHPPTLRQTLEVVPMLWNPAPAPLPAPVHLLHNYATFSLCDSVVLGWLLHRCRSWQLSTSASPCVPQSTVVWVVNALGCTPQESIQMAALAPEDSYLVMLARTSDLPDLQARLPEPLVQLDLLDGLSVGRAIGVPLARLWTCMTGQNSWRPHVQRMPLPVLTCPCYPATQPRPAAHWANVTLSCKLPIPSVWWPHSQDTATGPRPSSRPNVCAGRRGSETRSTNGSRTARGPPHSHEIPPRKLTRHQPGLFRH